MVILEYRDRFKHVFFINFCKSCCLKEVEKENSDNTRESRKGSFAYLAPLWIVILVFAVPATVFMIWKATKTCKSIIYSCNISSLTLNLHILYNE